MAAGRDITTWIAERQALSGLAVEPIGLADTPNWIYDSRTIRHESGRYFSIVGVRQVLQNGEENYQPLIDQPEIGILGFILVKSEDSPTQILLQAKTEPGNQGGTQIAPTVQATFSNYSQVHKGKPTKYLQFFLNTDRISTNTFQSEQGTRFLSKYNRNSCVLLSSVNELNEDLELNWRWFPLAEVLGLLSEDYLINTDSRSVLTTTDWKLLTEGGSPFQQNRSEFGRKLYQSYTAERSGTDFQKKLDGLRTENQFTVKLHPISELKGWDCSKEYIKNSAAFAIESFSISVKDREVERWSQPMLRTYAPGLVKQYCQVRDGVLHFLVSGSTEVGFREFVQWGPSYQLIDGVPLSRDITPGAKYLRMIEEFRQTDEGGRFYESTVHYTLQEIDEGTEVDLADDQCWMNLNDIHHLLPHKGMFTNEFRSVLSLVLKYL